MDFRTGYLVDVAAMGFWDLNLPADFFGKVKLGILGRVFWGTDFLEGAFGLGGYFENRARRATMRTLDPRCQGQGCVGLIPGQVWERSYSCSKPPL